MLTRNGGATLCRKEQPRYQEHLKALGQIMQSPWRTSRISWRNLRAAVGTQASRAVAIIAAVCLEMVGELPAALHRSVLQSEGTVLHRQEILLNSALLGLLAILRHERESEFVSDKKLIFAPHFQKVGKSQQILDKNSRAKQTTIHDINMHQIMWAARRERPGWLSESLARELFCVVNNRKH